MNNQEIYAKNLELFSRDNPLEAYRLTTENPTIKFCYTGANELSLIDESNGMNYYSPAGALLEAKEWAKGLKIKECDVVFVYGLGLGYYYFPLRDWLSESPGHYLVFLEESAAVINHFLATEAAIEILENPQVMVKLIPKVTPDEDGWAQLRVAAADVFQAFAFSKPYITALQAYFFNRFEFFHAFSLQWLTNLSRAARSIVEFYPMTPLIFQNFYANLLYLDEAIPGYLLANAMKSIPAVICGAGPSLDKQLDQLKTSGEQAFLMASGAAMNAITQMGIMPHAGGAIDPTELQAIRLLTSFGFDVPLFYQNRFNHQAFERLHGPKIFMVGSGGYSVSKWFEDELGIHGAQELIMGVSTSNFLVETANFLGCDPIILIGMDLSFRDKRRYSSGYKVQHPENINQEELDEKLGPLQSVAGIDGKNVYTTHQWYYEAVCFGAFKRRNPEVDFINATEGGMPIPEVPNEPFAKVMQEYGETSLDIKGWFHGVLQNAAIDKIQSEKVMQAVVKWRDSLEVCDRLLGLLIADRQQKLTHAGKEKVFAHDFYEGKAALWMYEMQQEAGYQFLLNTLNTVFNTLISLRTRNLKWVTEENHLRIEKFAIELERCRFLKTYVEDHLQSIQQGIEAFNRNKQELSNKVPQEDLPKDLGTADYKIENGILLIDEPGLNLKLEIDFNPQLIPKDQWPKGEHGPLALVGKVQQYQEGQTLYFYSDGTLKAEAFFKSGKLHGPWTFYSRQGALLYRSWYVEGKRMGKSWAYYADGAVFSISGYVDGMKEGRHLGFYPDGTLKILQTYRHGEFHGPVKLYDPNGGVQQELHFVNGNLSD